MSSPSVIEGRRRSRWKSSSTPPLKLRRSWRPCSHARSGLPNVVPASVQCPHEANLRKHHLRKTRSACQACCRPKSSAYPPSLFPEHVVTAKPSFEAMNQGSWSEIDIISSRNRKVLVHYVGTSSEHDEELPIDHLRLLSRQATDWDCTNSLMQGMDVCIFEYKTDAKANLVRWRDARLAKIDKRPHTSNCECQFIVQFYDFQQGQLPNESLSDDVKRVRLDKILLLQKPRKLSIMECLAVATNGGAKEKRRWSNDTRFLRDQFGSMKVNGEGHNLPPVESMPTGSNVVVNRNEQTKGLPLLDRQISSCTVPTGNIKDIQDDEVILVGNRKVIQDKTALMENSETIQYEKASPEKEGKAIQDEIVQRKVSQGDKMWELEKITEKMKASRKVIQNGNNSRKKQVVNKDALLNIKPVSKKIEVESAMQNESTQLEKIGIGIQAERALAGELEKIKALAEELEKIKPTTEERRDKENGNASVGKVRKCGKIIQDESALLTRREIVEEHGNTLLETKKAFKDESILQEDTKKEGKVLGSLLGKRNIDEKAVQDERPLLGKTKEEENRFMKTVQVCQNTSTRRKKTKVESDAELDAFFNGCHKNIPKESPEVAKFYWDESCWGEKIDTEAELDTKDDLQDIWDDMDIAFAGEEVRKVDNSRIHPLEVCKCGHTYSLDDDEGYVCDGCGNVGLAIEEILPKLIFKKSKREVNNGNNIYDRDEDKSDCEMPSCFEYTNVENGQLEASTDLHSVLQKHQKEGFDFLWAHLGGKQGDHGGCILSHAPGTGKTLLIIYFLHRYLQDNPVCNTLIVAPNAMLCPWEGEFQKWKVNIPVYILNGNKKYVDADEEEVIFSGSPRDSSRLSTLKCWLTNKSVLLISYKLFAMLITDETSKLRQKMRDVILEQTGLLILDEGHFPRATKTIVRQALMKVKTKNRILLSGTLFQNNFEELFNTLNLVREGFYENAPESNARHNFLQVVGNRYEKGQAKEELERKFQLLRKVSDSFVHHYAGEVLASLPGLFDYVIMLRPTSHQDDLLKKAMPKWERHINLETAITGICIHPSLICDLKFKDTIEVDHDVMKQLREVAEAGVKTKFVIDLLNIVKSTSEKVLIFSEKLYPFKLLEAIIEQTFHWIRGREVLRVDGSQSMDERQNIIDRFNQHNEARVLFASIRACGEGISLTGASRVVFLHMVWNAAVMRQAVSRAFRLGQKRRVFVYRLVASKTLEEEKYRTTLWKEWVSGSIYDASPGEAIPTDATTGASSSQGGASKGLRSEDVLLEKLLEHDKDTGMFVKVMEHNTESYLSNTSDMDDAWADMPDDNDIDTDIEDENDL